MHNKNDARLRRQNCGIVQASCSVTRGAGASARSVESKIIKSVVSARRGGGPSLAL